MNPIDIPPAWKDSADQILDKYWRRILVIGAMDRGKSTYCTFLAQLLHAAGAHIAFVDADVGQKDVGPPATISLTYPDAAHPLVQARPAAIYFVGAVSPAGHFPRTVIGTKRMTEAAAAPFVIINTTGLVHGSGELLKALQIESLQPDVVIALERGQELGSIIKAHRHYNIIRLRPSYRAAPKSNRARKEARALAFRSYFERAQPIIHDLRELIFQRSPVFNGEPFADPRFPYAERTAEGIVAVSEHALPEQHGVKVIPAGFERGLLCGVADHHGNTLGLAIIRKLDFQHGTISLLTPVPMHDVKVVQFGDLYLSPDGTELQHSILHTLRYGRSTVNTS